MRELSDATRTRDELSDEAILEYEIARTRDEVVALKIAWRKKEEELHQLETRRNDMSTTAHSHPPAST